MAKRKIDPKLECELELCEAELGFLDLGRSWDGVFLLTDKVRDAIRKGDANATAWAAFNLGRKLEHRRLEKFVLKEEHRDVGKLLSDQKRAKTAYSHAQRARELFKEWYLDLPKSGRPTLRKVHRDIADKIAREYNHDHDTAITISPSTVRQQYLKNSENL